MWAACDEKLAEGFCNVKPTSNLKTKNKDTARSKQQKRIQISHVFYAMSNAKARKGFSNVLATGNVITAKICFPKVQAACNLMKAEVGTARCKHDAI